MIHWGRLPLLDPLAQLLELGLLGVEVRLEIRVGQHVCDVVIEAVVLHEFVVEVEGHREPLRHGAVLEAQRSQHGHVRRLDAERGPVVEFDVAERSNLSDRKVPLGRLGLRRAGGGVVGIDLRRGSGTQGPSVPGHRVVNVAVDEIIDVVVVEGIADEGVGDAVLHSSQVDVRQRRLGHGGDDAGDTGELIGQGLIDDDVARVGAFLQRHDPEETVPLRFVQGDEVHVGEDILLQQHIDSGIVEERPFLVIQRQSSRRHRVVREVVVEQRMLAASTSYA